MVCDIEESEAIGVGVKSLLGAISKGSVEARWTSTPDPEEPRRLPSIERQRSNESAVVLNRRSIAMSLFSSFGCGNRFKAIAEIRMFERSMVVLVETSSAEIDMTRVAMNALRKQRF